jgi:ubiquinone/menaquinone biosynthesis C-methylase UbiE
MLLNEKEYSLSASVKQWEQYYRTGAYATGPVGADGSYDLEVRALWQAYFSSLTEKSRVLDVGTGNGVIAGIAVEVSNQHQLSLEVHGSDLAQIQPMRDVPDAVLRIQGVQFHPGIATESLPMADEFFDAVSGHYALEYAKTKAALAQIHRVLKPGGRALFVLHHQDSVLVKNALETIREGAYIVQDVKLYKKLRELLSYQGKSTEFAQKLSEPLRQGIRDVKALLLQATPQSSGQMARIALDATQKLMQMHGRIPSVDLIKEVNRAEQELQDAIQRVRDLVGVAQSQADIDQLVSVSQTIGFKCVNSAPLHHDASHLVGWALELSKSRN